MLYCFHDHLRPMDKECLAPPGKRNLSLSREERAGADRHVDQATEKGGRQMLNSQVVYPTQAKATFAACPGCGQRIRLAGKVSWGRKLTCPNCDAWLTVIDTTPIRLCWAYEEWDVDEDDW